MITRQGILNEVWQKWCELDNEDFDSWLHSEMINENSQKEVKNLNEKTETKPQQCNCVFNNRQVFCDKSCRYWDEA